MVRQVAGEIELGVYNKSKSTNLTTGKVHKEKVRNDYNIVKDILENIFLIFNVSYFGYFAFEVTSHLQP